MSLLISTKLRKKFGINPNELQLVKSFLQGAVYCWVKNKEDKPFAVRDLMGGANFDWAGTPLYCLYEKHISKGKANKDAIKEAGRDLGWILKSVLAEDKRIFESYNKGRVKAYKWIS